MLSENLEYVRRALAQEQCDDDNKIVLTPLIAETLLITLAVAVRDAKALERCVIPAAAKLPDVIPDHIIKLDAFRRSKPAPSQPQDGGDAA